MTKGIWRERWVEGGQERDLCAFSLFSVVWWYPGRKSERWSFSFLFVLFLDFVFPCGFSKPTAPSLPPLFYLLFSLVSTPRWKFEIILTCPFALMEKEQLNKLLSEVHVWNGRKYRFYVWIEGRKLSWFTRCVFIYCNFAGKTFPYNCRGHMRVGFGIFNNNNAA